MRPQSGSGAGAALSMVKCNPLLRIAPQLFRVLLLRRLRLRLLLARRFCWCGRLLDSRGHHCASCARGGFLGRRGFALESAAARVCRAAGARITTNFFLRDLDLGAPEARGGRRLEVVADGLPLFGGGQIAVDATLVSALHCEGGARGDAANRDGVALAAARRRKERTCPELVAPWSRCRLVVMANEAGGRWSSEALAFLRQLAKAKARSETLLMQRRVQQAWKLRWLATAARAVARSLLELRVTVEPMVFSLFLMRSRPTSDTRISSRFARLVRSAPLSVFFFFLCLV